jgi:hypothetical protein
MTRYGTDVEAKLAGDVDLDTLRWIWDRLAETGPNGKAYNEPFRHNLEESIRP